MLCLASLIVSYYYRLYIFFNVQAALDNETITIHSTHNSLETHWAYKDLKNTLDWLSTTQGCLLNQSRAVIQENVPRLALPFRSVTRICATAKTFFTAERHTVIPDYLRLGESSLAEGRGFDPVRSSGQNRSRLAASIVFPGGNLFGQEHR